MQKWEVKFMRLLTVYRAVRLFIQPMGIFLVILLGNTDMIETLLEINIWVLISDSIISNVFLVTSLRIFVVKFRQLVQLSEKDLRKLKIEYVVMMMTSVMRFVIDSIIFLLKIVDNECIGPV
jgi:hypothetical protein